MRKWIRNLHGGQLLMLLVAIATLGALPAAIGVWLMNLASGEYTAASRISIGVVSDGIPPDTAAAAILRASGNSQLSLGLKWLFVAVLILTVIPTALWVWFGARRTGKYVVEVLPE